MEYPFTMRRAAPQDKDGVTRLCQSVWADDWVPHAYDHFMADVAPSGLYLAEQEGRLIGCYHLSITPAGDAYFSAMRIDSSVQGRGFGTLFCRAQVEQAREAGAGHLYLLSERENARAHRTVEKNGFVNLGEWVVYYDQSDVQVSGAVRQARAARPSDLEAARRLAAAADDGPLSGVIANVDSGWGVQSLREADWAEEHLAVVDGPHGLSGLMLLAVVESERVLLIRRLEGTPEAAADLLAYAAREAEVRGLKSWEVGLPVRCEPLLAAAALNREHIFRACVFRLDAGVALPEL